MAEQQTSYEFVAVDAKDILADRQAGWNGFTTFMTTSIVATVVVLVALLVFVV